MNSALAPYVFTIERVVDAPLFAVWRAATERDLLQRWFGPRGCEIVESTLDLQVGGVYFYKIRYADGFAHYGRWVFREIELMRRLVMVLSHTDERGEVMPNPFGIEWPLEILNTFEFEEIEGKTKITVKWQALDNEGALEAGAPMCRAGWTGTLDTLGEVVTAELVEVRVSREFAFPIEKVFDAWLNPALAARFLYRTEGGESDRVEIDAREGGRWFISERRPQGVAEHFGTYLVIDRPYRLSFTFGTAPDEKSLVDIRFNETETGCTVELVHTFGQEWASYQEVVTEGWTSVLEGLSSV